MIKEFLEEVGIDARDIKNQNSYRYEENDNADKNIQTEAYRLYESRKVVKKIIYMILMIIAGIIVLRISTGVNILEILKDIFMNMF